MSDGAGPGALAIECRQDDAATAALLARIDHAPTRRAVEVERALLAVRGGGCHQRFGATQIELPGVGTLLYQRAAAEPEAESGSEPGADAGIECAQLHWTPEQPLQMPEGTITAWDGSRAARSGIEPVAAGIARSSERLQRATAVFIAHRRALPELDSNHINPAAHVWVPGVDTWQALAERGIWVEGCAESLGFATLEPMLSEPLLQLPPRGEWTVLTHADAVAGWPAGEVIATYRHGGPSVAGASDGGPSADATHLYWHSSAQFDRWRSRVAPLAQHACGPGKTYEHLRRAGVQNLRVFPQPAHWRQWLGM